MTPKVKFYLIGTLLLIIFNFFCTRSPAQTSAGGANNDSVPAGKIFAEPKLTSNWIENGLTQSEKSFAFQSSLGYQWTQFRAGVWGSNVKYPNSGDNLNLRLFFAYKFIFTSQIDLNAQYTFNRSYTEGSRNGTLMLADLRFYRAHILLSTNSNWENWGSSSRYAFSYDWDIPWNLNVRAEGGYNMVKADDYSNYFDLTGIASYKYADLTYGLGAMFNSNAAQFSGRGDLQFFLEAGARF